MLSRASSTSSWLRRWGTLTSKATSSSFLWSTSSSSSSSFSSRSRNNDDGGGVGGGVGAKNVALPPPKLRKVLVANRGEIACRVMRTCRRLGIPTVAVYSPADGPRSLHASMADESYPIGTGPSPSESYLLADEIIRVATESGADSVHPGYGFLSENASFVRSLRDRAPGVEFVGPPPSAMTSMASKSESKSIMERAGVPTTPGYYDPSTDDPEKQSADFLLDRAVNDVGFPLLIKAVMGGGGKGMRLVWDESEFRDALTACQNESSASFGDSSVLLEKYLVRPRHVEVQVIADKHDNVVHLFERDCSLQRRHQKIIEEAPASDLPPHIRTRLGDMGKRAARAVGYQNAGTVEFLLDTADPESFYFCEMNTRLQVEHPITEQITGIDLVEWQLRVAAGEELPVTDQDDISAVGHAFEARIYAENPARDFLPATGRVWHHDPPCPINSGMSSDGIRVDTGVAAGHDVGVYYDPMISKLIVHGKNRDAALKKLVHSLRRYRIAGVSSTNIDFLIKCARHPAFGAAGQVNTGFLEDYADDVRMRERPAPPKLVQAVGSFVSLLHMENRLSPSTDSSSSASSFHPWSSSSGSWRIGGRPGLATRTLRLEDVDDDDAHVTAVCRRDGSFDIKIVAPRNEEEDGGEGEEIKKRDPEEEQWVHVSGTVLETTGIVSKIQVVVDGTKRIEATVVLVEEDGVIRVRMWPERSYRDDIDDDDQDYHDDHHHHHWQLNVENPVVGGKSRRDASGSSGAGSGLVKAPMPGTIRKVHFESGDDVHKGDVVMIMEAMKMEHAIRAPGDGILSDIVYKEGDVVDDGAVLLRVRSHDEDDDAVVGETERDAA